MTDTLISLISIFVGILGALLMGLYFKKYSFGLTGNTIAGVFGSIFLIKSFGRWGFNPPSIMHLHQVHYPLLALNLIVSFIGGGLALIFLSKVKNILGR